MKPSYKPTCPNHGCPLDGMKFPLPEKGEGICPVSGAHFEFEASVDEEAVVKDKFGRLVKKPTWEMKGNE